jgi:ribosomal protein L11 methyltransferase
VPYRVDLRTAAADAFDRLVELGALDAELSREGGLSALMPDSVASDQIGGALGVAAGDISISPAVGRDADSVWVLSPRAIRVGRLRIVPAHMEAEPDALRLVDTAAFGTGLHPTTALCLEALEEAVEIGPPDGVLDVGTGSGILALGALMMGVPRAHGVDIEEQALRVAAENARINGLDQRLQLTPGGPEAVTGAWPLVLANVLPGPLIEMAPDLVRRVGHHGQLVLSGIPSSVEYDVDAAYRHLGMRRLRVKSRAGWVALVLQASW